ncbi:GINS complex Psf3 component [Punctularia strigosozonata HHB-11173 SS5]|uniref:GINS complex Psf3 component n=1 Tax=Punctularia strigosozonata (strain HHB-11173) TaxID=741275 RepID=UPI0004417CF0|nr:GINS complex Psf3 component [Punctularia strigosozonata HHB-11173 SS5]EIN10864.1 GINS complex Psf3 component [Punctularia strigosozonata HHB-11173 SS5]
MEDDYYSVDAILAENQKIQLTFKVDVPDMGHLDGGKERDIKPLSKVSIPLWLAYILIMSDYADFSIPPPFSSRVRNALNAEPKSVKLSGLVGQGGLWYGFGKMVMRLLDEPSADEMSTILTKTFKDRLIEVIDQAQHFGALGTGSVGGGGDLTQSFREGLDGTERELFALAQQSAKNAKRWYETTDRARK